jgi:hypothetical protein
VAAEDVVPARVAARLAGRAERARNSAYYFRFTLAYTLLAVIATAGIATLVIVLTRPDAVPAPPWSTFVPTGSPVAKVRQIATQVSSEYRLPAGGKVVTIVPAPLQGARLVQTASGPATVEVPVSAVAIQADASTGKHEEGDYTAFNAGSTIAYQMCGFGTAGQNCGVATLAASANRSSLLRREALELSLYTLKYVPGIDAVLTYLPPPASGAQPASVFIARNDVGRNLDRPLKRTLTPTKLVLGDTPADHTRVEELTRSRLYNYDFQVLPGDSTFIVVLSAALSAQ